MDAKPEAVAEALVARALDEVERRGLEFSSFLVGLTHDDPAVATDALEDWKRAVKRAAGIRLFERWRDRGMRVDVDLVRPDLRVLYEPRSERIRLVIAHAFIYGRYRKLVRNLPQTRWHCRACRGRGCRRCDFTGRQYRESVEELLGDPLAQAFRAEGEPVLHGAGREDLDVRTLGRGRPFVVELASPRLRSSVDLGRVAGSIDARAAGKVELASPLVLAPPEAVARVKALGAPKRYRALVRCEGRVDPAALAAIELRFSGVRIEQRTPERVAHRRADLVRARTVVRLSARAVDERSFEVELETEAGTYVKELVSGDDGRTSPSVSEALGVACRVAELDVLDVEADDAAILAPRAS